MFIARIAGHTEKNGAGTLRPVSDKKADLVYPFVRGFAVALYRV